MTTEPAGEAPVDHPVRPLPEAATKGTFPGPYGYSREQMLAYAAEQVAAERDLIAAHLSALGLDDAAQDVLMRNWPNVALTGARDHGPEAR